MFGLGLVGGITCAFPAVDCFGAEVHHEAEFVFGHSEFLAEFADVFSGFWRWGQIGFIGNWLFLLGRSLGGLFDFWCWEINGVVVRGNCGGDFDAEDIGKIIGCDASSLVGF